MGEEEPYHTHTHTHTHTHIHTHKPRSTKVPKKQTKCQGMNFNPWKRNFKKLDKVWILHLMSDPKGIGFETKYSTSQNVGPSTWHIKKKKKSLVIWNNSQSKGQTSNKYNLPTEWVGYRVMGYSSLKPITKGQDLFKKSRWGWAYKDFKTL